ncbi:hypothetical protein FRC19_001706 [Serendipita sp. 401]|nr:hypothetical protein FRC19_001706 [Serendipita sp. 401]
MSTIQDAKQRTPRKRGSKLKAISHHITTTIFKMLWNIISIGIVGSQARLFQPSMTDSMRGTGRELGGKTTTINFAIFWKSGWRRITVLPYFALPIWSMNWVSLPTHPTNIFAFIGSLRKRLCGRRQRRVPSCGKDDHR